MAALTEAGFNRPTYDDLLQIQIAKAKELFGDDIETSDTTALGKFIRITTYDLATAYEELESTYYSKFPNTATGISLDRLCVFSGISRNPPTAAIHTVRFTGTAGYTIETGFLVGTISNITFYVDTDAVVGAGGTVDCQVYCSDLGEVGNVALGDITQIVNPVAEISGIEHISIDADGQEEETDTALRKRFTQAVAGSGSGTADSLVSAILRVSGVNGCTIIENDTNTTDSAGRPPHSFEIYVDAASVSDEAIAEAIFSKKPVGIKSVTTSTGNYSVTVQIQDTYGNNQTISFSRVLQKTIYLKATVNKTTAFETDGIQQIKDNISEYINNLKNGEDVVYSSLFSCFYVNGVKEVTNLEISSDGTNYVTTRITCNASQIARISDSNIVLTEGDYIDG